MSNTTRYILGALLILLVLFIGYKLLNIIIYIVIAAVLALIGQPLMKQLTRIGIGAYKLPPGFAAIITILIFLGIIAGFFILFIPPMVQKISYVSELDLAGVSAGLETPLLRVQEFLQHYGLLAANKNLEEILLDNIKSFFNLGKVSGWINGIIGLVGNVIAAVFSVAFILYFLLTDRNLIHGFMRKVVPQNRLVNYENATSHISHLLTRYFTGLFIQGTIFTIILFIGLKIIGSQNPMLTAFFGGLMNVIPYIGPLIGFVFGIFIEITSSVGENFSNEILPTCLWMALAFYVSQMIDNWIVQPYIFSNSINAHPLEIFLVVLMAGTLGGIVGMIIAIPLYSALRVIAKEFLSEFSIIQRLTEDIHYPEEKNL